MIRSKPGTMSIPYRQPAESPPVKRAIEALKQARMHFGFFDEYRKKDLTNEIGTMVASLVLDHQGNREDDDIQAALDQSHQAMWNAINEARTLLFNAGYDFDAGDEAWWAGRNDATAPAEALTRLEALLPHADFSVEQDDEAEAFIAAQKRGKRLWIWAAVLVFTIPLVAILVWATLQ